MSLSLRHRGCFTKLEAWRFMRSDWARIPGQGMRGMRDGNSMGPTPFVLTDISPSDCSGRLLQEATAINTVCRVLEKITCLDKD